MALTFRTSESLHATAIDRSFDFLISLSSLVRRMIDWFMLTGYKVAVRENSITAGNLKKGVQEVFAEEVRHQAQGSSKAEVWRRDTKVSKEMEKSSRFTVCFQYVPI